MKKRILSIILVFAMILSCLTGCGKKDAASYNADSYVSSKPMPLFDALEAIQGLKDYSFDLSVYALLDQDGTQGDLLYTMSGVSFESSKQAKAVFNDLDGNTITELYVDGTTCYVDYYDAISFVKAGYENAEFAEMLSEDIAAFQEIQDNSARYLTFELKEDPWTTMHGDDAKAIRDLISDVFKDLKRQLKDKNVDGKRSSSMTVAGVELQHSLLTVLDSLLLNAQTYQEPVNRYLGENFADFIDISAWTPEEITDSYWSNFDSLELELVALMEEGEWVDWSVRTISCGDETNGYSVDITGLGAYNRNACLNVVPAQAVPVEYPGESDCADLSSDMENASYIYQCFRDQRRSILESYRLDNENSDEIDMSDDDFESGIEDGNQVSDELETTPIEGYERISLALGSTEDGYDMQVPVLSAYSYAEIVPSELSKGSSSIMQQTDSCTLEWYSLDSSTRTPEEILSDNVYLYEEIYRDEWEYPILIEPVKFLSTDDGRTCVGAMAYHDNDENTDVTLINLATLVDGSEYAMCAEARFYSDTLTNRDLNAVEDLLGYLGLEMPITVVGSKK